MVQQDVTCLISLGRCIKACGLSTNYLNLGQRGQCSHFFSKPHYNSLEGLGSHQHQYVLSPINMSSQNLQQHWALSILSQLFCNSDLLTRCTKGHSREFAWCSPLHPAHLNVSAAQSSLESPSPQRRQHCLALQLLVLRPIH